MAKLAVDTQTYIISLSISERRKQNPINLRDALTRVSGNTIEIVSGEPYGGYKVIASTELMNNLQNALHDKIAVDLDQALDPL